MARENILFVLVIIASIFITTAGTLYTPKGNFTVPQLEVEFYDPSPVGSVYALGSEEHSNPIGSLKLSTPATGLEIQSFELWIDGTLQKTNAEIRETEAGSIISTSYQMPPFNLDNGGHTARARIKTNKGTAAASATFFVDKEMPQIRLGS